MGTATNVEGIFRLSGSAKRIKELQAIFDSPDRYGKGLDWQGYTVHDAANVLRRYLNQLPQPIVPLDFYERCREPLRSHQAQAVGDTEAQAQDVGNFDQNAAITTYQHLITELPPLNRQLLLYILDLLAVFASKSDLNRMNSVNLAAIFQPGLLSHPAHDMIPDEYRLSQNVLVFLIENQDSFLIGMNGTAADEKTVKEVQSGGPRPGKPQSPSSPRPSQAALGRSASNASAGADSLRKFGGVRRNVSVSSKNSKTSINAPSPIPSIPGSPHAGINSGTGVQRSNTLPSKKSPGIPSRFTKQVDSPTPTAPAPPPASELTPTARASSPGSESPQAPSEGPLSPTTSSLMPTLENTSALPPVEESKLDSPTKEKSLPTEQLGLQPPEASDSQTSLTTPRGERKLSGLFSKSPTPSETERGDLRQPNKLRKKRLTDSSNPSAQSSSQSLHGLPDSPSNQGFYTPMPTPSSNVQPQEDPLASSTLTPSNTDARQDSETLPRMGVGTQEATVVPPQDLSKPQVGSSLKPSNSPSISVHSRASVTDFSEASHTDDAIAEAEHEKRKRRWRFSSPAKKNAESRTALSASSQRGRSNTSVGSSTKPRKSVTRESQQPSANASASSHLQTSSNETTPSKEKGAIKDNELPKEQAEKKGPFGWFKAKVAQAKEDKKERENEKERAKSPIRSEFDQAAGTPNLAAVAQAEPVRRKSVDPKSGPSKDESELATRSLADSK